MAYSFDAGVAKSSEGDRITSSGKYKGQFLMVYKTTAKTGAIGISFNFKSDDGQSCDNLVLYTLNKEGKAIYGFKILQAVMGILGVQSINESPAKVELWDSGAGKKTLQDAEVYLDLMKKPIGLLLQREEYKNSSGETKFRMAIIMPFTHGSELSVAELLSGAVTGTAVAQRMVTLEDKKVESKLDTEWTNSFNNSTIAGDATAPAFDDDIPFN